MTQDLVGTHPAGKNDATGLWMGSQRKLELLEQNIAGGRLEGSRKIGLLLGGEVVLELVGWSGDRESAGTLDGPEDGSFEPREGKIEVGDVRMGEMIGVGIAGLGAASDGRSAGVRQTENLGDLVKTFADSIVASGADNFELVMSGHIENLSMAARDDEGEQGELGEGSRIEPVGIDMGFEVVDGIERLLPENGESARGERADEERAEQAWSMSDGDGVDFSFGEVGVLKCLMNNWEDGFKMRAGGDLWNYPTISCKNVNL